ncbi:PH domain-containing protein [Elizabethkingia anophelis]|uniref:PH domain-containing protein n=1 Tax=Elizabethkingia anophelis TaxID=1117645 RepID=UPI0021A7FAA5|nr:PH domain-containing protein [Elizabethkingia anophelis]MCT3977741.1 PH domain-containing protein [Elizabethkingia anophelis]MCT4041356.1 PH domain-containing protein [Elizabethkingia anophelis]
MKNIPVKIGWETIILIAVPLLFPLYFVFTDKDYIPLTILIPAIIFVSILIMGISYRIINNELIIRNSIFGSTRIPISDIKSIKKTKNPISSPAPSILGRIEIIYKNGSIIISPKDFDLFKNELLKINPNITF